MAKDPKMKIVKCCSCKWPTDADDRRNVRIGITALEGVRCQTCDEARKSHSRGNYDAYS